MKNLSDASAAEQRCVVDGNVITSRAPGFLEVFFGFGNLLLQELRLNLLWFVSSHCPLIALLISCLQEIIRQVLGEERMQEVAAPMLVTRH